MLAVTGHRPKDLFGYDMSDKRYLAIRDALRDAVLRLETPEFYTGMALGIDQIAAMAVLDAKQAADWGITLHAAVPCPGQDNLWRPESRKLYADILARCDRVTMVSNAPYTPALMHARNAFMCRQADAVIAVWDSRKKSGGTYSCIREAFKKKKPVLRIDPFDPSDARLLTEKDL